jgi:hypothetical protein
MTALPPVVDPEAALAHTVERGAAATGGNVSAALRSLRLLLPNAGTSETDVYAYVPSQDAFCFILWRRQGACSNSPDGTRGVRFLVSPGGPGYVGIGPNAPAAVGGVVSDEVKAVDIVQDERTTSVPIINNAFCQELEPSTSSGSPASLTFTYSDGSQRNLRVQAAG